MRSPAIPVLRRWKLMAVFVGVAALTASSGLAAPSDPATALGFHPVTPTVRVLDTRNGTGAPAAPVGASATLQVVIPGLPDDAIAVALNVTVVGGTMASHLKAFPKGATEPETAVLAWSTTITMSTTVVVPLGTDDSVSFFNKNGTVHVVADLVGLFAPGAPGAVGPEGPAGPAGADGTDGVDGVSPGSVLLYATNTIAQRIALAGMVTFPNVVVQNSTLTDFIVPGPNVDNALVAGEFMVSADGLYKVTFSVSAAQASQLDLFVNGSSVGQKYGAAVGQANSASAFLTLAGGDILSLRNITSTGSLTDDAQIDLGDLTLPALLGGTAAAVNASISIELVSPAPSPI